MSVFDKMKAELDQQRKLAALGAILLEGGVLLAPDKATGERVLRMLGMRDVEIKVTDLVPQGEVYAMRNPGDWVPKARWFPRAPIQTGQLQHSWSANVMYGRR